MRPNRPYPAPRDRFGSGAGAQADGRQERQLAETKKALLGPDDSGDLSDVIGRHAQTTALTALLATTNEQRSGGAVLLTGSPGAGRSLLQAWTAREHRRRGGRVVGAVAVEAEQSFPYSVLHQLLYALREQLGRLRRPQRSLLEGLLTPGVLPPAAAGAGSAAGSDELLRDLAGGTAPGGSELLLHRVPEPRSGGAGEQQDLWTVTVAVSVLALLHEAAQERPLLLSVDDAQWTDAPSARVLGFIARRLRTEPVALLASVRADQPGALAAEHLPELLLPPLGRAEAGRLLDLRRPGLDPGVRAAVLRSAQGNPRALLDMPERLTAAQRAGTSPLPDPLPVSSRTVAPLLARIAQLPPAASEFLLLAALERSAELRVLWSVVPDAASALAALERADLAVVDGNRLVLTDPLLRAAAVRGAAPEQLRAAHRLLALSPEQTPDGRAAHLGAAALGVDEEAAAAMEAASARMTARGALETLRRASDLSPDLADRHRRLVLATRVAAWAGWVDTAAGLLSQARSAVDLSGRNPADAAWADAVAEAEALVLVERDGDAESAASVLAAALASPALRASSRDRMMVLEGALTAVCEAGVLSFPATAPCPDRGAASGDGPPGTVRTGRRCPGGPTGYPSSVTALAEARLRLPTDGVLGTLRAATQQAADDAAVASWAAVRVSALLLLARDAYARGHWSEAETLAAEGRAVALECRLASSAALLGAAGALAAAARGDGARAAALPDEAGTVGRTAVAHVRLMAALALDDAAGAAAAEALMPLNPAVPGLSLLVLDRVEAALRGGDRPRAEAVAASVGRPRSPRAAALLAAARILLAGPTADASATTDALAALAAAEAPFEHARLRLARGRALLDGDRCPEAADELATAISAFRRLGAVSWAEAARSARRGTAGSTHVTGAARQDRTELTAQELQIARLAATGLSNRQIAERLFVSHRTVSTHLYNLFPKLRITSRSALRDALVAAGLDENVR
ncbi:LuxR C-terminal-related transcriptional regulator [Streptomyces sp. TLI_171]|uniref:LuxR C-terminal-related transcriptional regulator n=1 Tax=Streptomyces sp. TLI_171 TaxID=1938859 RepID=UPI000C3A53A5|nr:helix-turn-helix transcriptional regulator [Streptomyces sp. TLI_171]RKE22051.1 AAA ATPase-like protein [Streptomyces sp. TLI_171]